MKLVTSLVLLSVIMVVCAWFFALAGCYDASKAPPCDPRYPDPTMGCFGVSRDAGLDG